MAKPLWIRFHEKFTVNPESDCWEWTGSVNNIGYGNISYGNRHWKSHRAAWILYKGPISDGMHVLHKCDNRRCVNPDHLFLGSHTENVRDMYRKGRGQVGEDHSRAQLTAKDVLAIRASNKPNSALAEKYGVTAGHIWRIKKGHLWANLNNTEKWEGANPDNSANQLKRRRRLEREGRLPPR